MKKIVMIFLMSVVLTGCTLHTDDKTFVKNIYFSLQDNLYSVTVQSYDFSHDEESYISKTFSGNDLKSTVVSASDSEKYNFRLCENVFVSTLLLQNNTNEVFSVINSLKIPPNTDIACVLGDVTDCVNQTDSNINTKLYDFSQVSGKYSGIIALADSTGKDMGAVIIENGFPVKHLTENQWKVLNILTDKLSETSFIFKDKQLLCEIENISCFYSVSDVLEINITFSIKDYKGIVDSVNSMDLFRKTLVNEIENTVYQLYNDIIVCQNCNLYWYCKQKGADCSTINVNVKTI